MATSRLPWGTLGHAVQKPEFPHTSVGCTCVFYPGGRTGPSDEGGREAVELANWYPNSSAGVYEAESLELGGAALTFQKE